MKSGHYSKNTKLTVLLGVEPGNPALAPGIIGSTANPRRWLQILMQSGTSTFGFNGFVDMICQDLVAYQPPGEPADQTQIFYGII